MKKTKCSENSRFTEKQLTLSGQRGGWPFTQERAHGHQPWPPDYMSNTDPEGRSTEHGQWLHARQNTSKHFSATLDFTSKEARTLTIYKRWLKLAFLCSSTSEGAVSLRPSSAAGTMSAAPATRYLCWISMRKHTDTCIVFIRTWVTWQAPDKSTSDK